MMVEKDEEKKWGRTYVMTCPECKLLLPTWFSDGIVEVDDEL
jgi:hypothetical protein